MAALQKIRSWGTFTIIVIGLALFAFIAGDFAQGWQSMSNEQRQRVGEVYGESLGIQEYQKMVDEYSEIIKNANGLGSLTEDQMTYLRDQMWQTYVNNQVINHEAKALGLSVSDEELRTVINEGSHQMLRNTPFTNPQTGLFDVNILKQFKSEMEKIKLQAAQMPAEQLNYFLQMESYWDFTEKNLRETLLAEKYQTLLSKSMISNPVSAKMAFDGRVNQKDIVMAAVPYRTIADSTITVSDSDLKAKYNEWKEAFKQDVETRDIKYIDITVRASAADKKALDEEMNEYSTLLAESAEVAKLVRESGSTVSYSRLPIRKSALPTDIANVVDTLGVGVQKGPFYSGTDNTMNIVKVISKVSLPDSIEVRQIGVPGADMAAIEKTADSIMTALNAGTPFDTIAKKYDQTAEKRWIVSAEYENTTLDENNRHFITILNGMPVNAIEKIVLKNQGIVITQVTDRRAMTDKYDVAVIKRPIEFSKETYTDAYNKFSQFLAANTTVADIEANAMKEGYMVQNHPDMTSNIDKVAGVNSTRDVLRWIFSEDTDEGAVSQLYECGDNDHMLVVMMTKIHPEGYRSLDDEQVREFVKAEVLKDKKAAQLQEQMKSAASLADVQKLAGVRTDTVKHITFNSPTYVSLTGSSEGTLSAAVSDTENGKFVAGVKGNGGVYAFQVIGGEKRADQFDAKAEESQLANRNLSIVMRNLINELTLKADVKDNRYLFY